MCQTSCLVDDNDDVDDDDDEDVDDDDDDKATSWSNIRFLRIFCYKKNCVMDSQTNGPADGQSLL